MNPSFIICLERFGELGSLMKNESEETNCPHFTTIENNRSAISIGNFCISWNESNICGISKLQTNDTNNCPTDDTWLYGALIVLFLFILIQFSWLCKSPKNIKEIFNSKIPRLRDDQIKSLERLGAGQFGEVWLCKVTYDSGKIILAAAKHPKTTTDRESLFTEAISLTNLEHENIVKVIGLCMHFGLDLAMGTRPDSKYHPVLVFEHLNGGNCQDYFSKHYMNININELRKVALDIVEACIYMSTCLYIHRDIALRNILLQIFPDPVVPRIVMAKLADFGLAKDVGGRGPNAYEGNSPFPSRSTAPEGLSRKEFTTKSDVWSYGVLLWEMFETWFTGEQQVVPYSDVEISMLQIHICENKHILPKPVRCPPNFYDSILKPCWAFKHNDRPDFSILKESILEHWDEVDQPPTNNVNSRQRNINTPASHIVKADVNICAVHVSYSSRNRQRNDAETHLTVATSDIDNFVGRQRNNVASTLTDGDHAVLNHQLDCNGHGYSIPDVAFSAKYDEALPILCCIHNNSGYPPTLRYNESLRQQNNYVSTSNRCSAENASCDISISDFPNNISDQIQIDGIIMNEDKQIKMTVYSIMKKEEEEEEEATV